MEDRSLRGCLPGCMAKPIAHSSVGWLMWVHTSADSLAFSLLQQLPLLHPEHGARQQAQHRWGSVSRLRSGSEPAQQKEGFFAGQGSVQFSAVQCSA